MKIDLYSCMIAYERMKAILIKTYKYQNDIGFLPFICMSEKEGKLVKFNF